MRFPLRSRWTAPLAGSQLKLVRVEGAMFRDFWFRSTGGPLTYHLEVYDTRADAEAGMSPLADADHGPGPSVNVDLVAIGGAAFDPTPMRAVLYAVGQWTEGILGWTDTPELSVLDRVATVLSAYQSANEALAEVATLQIGHTEGPNSLFPIVCVTTGFAGADQSIGASLWQGTADIDLVIWTLEADAEASFRSCAKLAGALRSICLDEQRTWAGFATETKLRGLLQVANEQRQNAWLHQAVLPLSVVSAESQAQRTVGGGQSDGGKYVAGL